MKRLIFYAESPHNCTGFAQVNKHIAQAIAPVCHLEWVASSHWSPHLDKDTPYVIHACAHDARNLDTIMARLESREWDIFFYQGDIGANDDVLWRAIQIASEDPTKNTIYYAPLDVDDFLPELFDVMAACHVPILYTQHGVDLVTRKRPDLAGRLSAIGLGTEPDVFFPLEGEEKARQRSRLFGIEDDTFLVINVNRNQMRKDLARSMALFHAFHMTFPHSLLYLHSVIEDYGGNLQVQAKAVGMNLEKKPAEIAFSSLDLSSPWSREELNNLYNAANCLISTSYGEGWGLSTTEAMCAGLPVVVPANTANIDILGEDQERGYLVRTGGDVDHTAFLYEGGGSPHDVVHSEDFLWKLSDVYYGTVGDEDNYVNEIDKEILREKCTAARNWCLQNTWEHRSRLWRSLIQTLSEEA